MQTKIGAVYRVTYRRQKWNKGRESRRLFFTQGAAERFAEKLQRTRDVSVVEYADVAYLAGAWTPVEGHTFHDPGKRTRSVRERAVGDWTEEDEDEAGTH